MIKKELIQITIDGKTLNANAGKTILEVAQENGIHIPTLCYDPRLPPYGSCLLCVVEVEGVNKLLLACATEIRPGMVIKTRSEKIFKARKNALDLLVSNHFADCRGNCYEKCPAGIDVQGYLALANQGKYREALELIRERNPLPLICGRVCVRYCEGECRRKDVDESAVGVNFIKRYVADLEYDNLPPPIVPQSIGKKVAIVGGGPGGLTAAYFLAKSGIKVTIFDMQPKLGGMVVWGIPEYRLPERIVQKEIQYILNHGIEVKTNSKLGRDFTLDNLKEQGFDAIILAIGAQVAKKMGVKNEEADGVWGGIYFLDKVKKEGFVPLSGHVLVVGGGNTAIDCARTALRCNAEKVTILYRRTREEMPADEIEIADAIAEGVEIKFLCAPLEVIAENGKVKALKCQEMQLGEPDASGRRRPIPIPGSDYEIPCTTIIAAIGQDCDLTCIKGNKIGEIQTTKWNTIAVNERTFATNIEGIFAIGDVVSGPAAVIDAIGAARKAAFVINNYLRTGEIRPFESEFLSKKLNFGPLPKEMLSDVPKTERSKIIQEDPLKRIKNFCEVDHGIRPESVKSETDRCMSCGCTSVFTCELKKLADEYSVDQKRFLGKVRYYKVDTRHPFISLDPNKCILCGKCVRLCSELIGVSALGFVNRGFETIVKPSMDKPLQETTCISCGNCIDICPTGAIDYRYSTNKPGPWITKPRDSVCSYCGVGCQISFNCTDDDLWYVSAKKEQNRFINEICIRGRFGQTFLHDSSRIITPRINKSKEKLDINTAIEKAVEGLKHIAAVHGADSLGFFVSPKLTNEEIYLVRKIAIDGFKTTNVSSFSLLSQLVFMEKDGLNATWGYSTSTLPQEQIEKTHVIVLINADPATENPVLAFRIKRAERNGAQVVSIGSFKNKFWDTSSIQIKTHAGTNFALIAGICRMILDEKICECSTVNTTGFEVFKTQLPDLKSISSITGVDAAAIRKLAQLLGDPQKSVVFVYNADAFYDRSIGDLSQIANLLMITGKVGKVGNGIILSRDHCNSQGFVDIASTLTKSHENLFNSIITGKIKGIFVIGENPFGDETFINGCKNAEFVVALDIMENATTEFANVVIPFTVLPETDGSITSFDRRVRTFNAAFKPIIGKMGWEILSQFFAKVTSQNSPTFYDIRREIGETYPHYSRLTELKANESFIWCDHENPEGLLFTKSFLTSNGKAKFIPPAQFAQVIHGRKVLHAAIDRYFEGRVKNLLQSNNA